MKKIKLLAFICLTQLTFSQVGIGTTTPHPSSILHLNSTTSGLLIPRLTTTQKNAVVSPATGLLIYQTDGAAGFWYYTGTTWVPFGGGTAYTFNNGLSLTGNNAQLGGTLIKTTTIDFGNNDLTFRTTSSSSYPGEFTIQGENRGIMQTRFKDNYVEFGGDFAFLGTSVDGTNLTTSGGDNYTIDVVAGFQSNGVIGGSSIRIGSVEHIMDGLSELYIEGGGLHPREDQTSSFGTSLGASSKRWAAVYANNGVIQTSDITLKKNIQPIKYGLKEILKLNPITYNWKENKVGNTEIPVNQQELKLGFSAQELSDILPEVVQTHSWVPADEEGNYKRVENDKLGVNYAEIIPVLVNAIKEQQQEIIALKKLIKAEK